jgi:hypothetical protein
MTKHFSPAKKSVLLHMEQIRAQRMRVVSSVVSKVLWITNLLNMYEF